MWNSGNTPLSLPIELIQEPDTEWGTRKMDQNHVKVIFKILKI